MHVNLLGPLEVLREGVLVTPSAPKLRQVISLLVIRANTVVRRDRLVDELWDDDPPASVVTTVQTYIYQLRKQLRLSPLDGGPGQDHGHRPGRLTPALETSPHGYQLKLDTTRVDLTRFEELAVRGRIEASAGDLASASRTFGDAARMWRGPTLVDVPLGPVLQGEVLRLEELRMNVLQQRLEADLQLGRHQELLGELTRLAADQPTNESYQAMLMLALHRSDRRADALRVYQRARIVLADRLGLDPSNRLQWLQQSVLASDPSLDPPARPGSRTVVRAKRPR
ncbi:MAG: Cys-tRNA(Pro) deacylase YbaK [uncultured Pseudonocardia sp.]|uniref:Cys-tRNA(Pro) deacylase YbaK n=1 Tax=uncultured Pseudonocardia sp. TaxID=211455 RepID=A0A6J4QR22_9PSEU|nr:MAG: Cys-tRNA(Pro) deacylase YbaK [uncultured Pseudonocardia sp.]